MLFGIHESSISEYFLETSFFGFMQPIWRHAALKESDQSLYSQEILVRWVSSR